ncbi:putative FAD-dependent oxygenase [Bimuria novae-zelandiae CBS 107.79]|uniref:Putative FAD-dependent oxygenase n=1 Tax=Bimuria novae-zelandiae CBS 107.79 TaxID=1447943 RepID=A0A6A5V9G8_9PLEO|nr:putative FAD-dependent oxygenase [Bimuria novae-zelandiae CBS 107.79]
MSRHSLLAILLVGVVWTTGCLCDVSVLSVRNSLPTGQACGGSLAENLSSGARIYCPGSEEFTNSTQRWSTLDAPTFRLTVEVATENDVVEVVKYANQQNTSFLAVNNAHGAIITTGRVQNGIMIWMRQLDSIKIAEDGQTATFGGGIIDKTVTDGLWAARKQTVTGGCECVSVIGPGLGGGHGFLQGRHGLVSDQFVSLNMVMADGTLQTIDATHELWWAVRGAGHNFGIVTSITSKIYDVKYPQWSFQNFTFTGDKVEALFENINKYLLQNGTQPVDLWHHAFFSQAGIVLYILQEGVEAVSSAYTAPFLALHPVTTFAGTGDYPDLPGWVGWGRYGGTCHNAGLTATTRFPIELQTYDVRATRRVYDLFISTLNEIPALNRSAILLEGYAQQGVKAIPAKDSAYPFRGSNLLVAPVIRFVEGSKELEESAVRLGEALRDIFHESSGVMEKRVYVNYALGTESVGETYGEERWRLRRLRRLKRKWDPEGRFSFYAPIA